MPAVVVISQWNLKGRLRKNVEFVHYAFITVIFFFLSILVLYVQNLNMVVLLSFIVVICAQELRGSRSLS